MILTGLTSGNDRYRSVLAGVHLTCWSVASCLAGAMWLDAELARGKVGDAARSPH
jgi:hypothetical protein